MESEINAQILGLDEERPPVMAETETETSAATALPPVGEKEIEAGVAGCEEVLLPAMPITNGATSGADEIDYLEESDPMGDLNDLEAVDKLEDVLADRANVFVGQEEEEEDDEEEPENLVDEDIGTATEMCKLVAPGQREGQEDEPDEEAGAEVPAERTPTQVPKKRKDAAMLAAAEAEADATDGNKSTTETATTSTTGEDAKVKAENEEEEERALSPTTSAAAAEEPTSSARAATTKENSVDEEQCRVCTTKDDLVSLFKVIEQQSIADMLTTICPAVSIAPKDFMPQYICNPCLDNVTIAVQLKTQCESTDRELRKKLSRSKNKVRRPTGYVVIDAPLSEPPSEDDHTDDVEFKVSDEASASASDYDSEDSEFSTKKKRPARGGTARRGGRRKSAVTPTLKSKGGKKGGSNSSMKRSAGDEESSEEETVLRTSSKKKRKSQGDKSAATAAEHFDYPCDECEQVFARKLSLVLHKKAHSGSRNAINCEVCGKQFKILGAYKTHLEKHMEEEMEYVCSRCNDIFTSKADYQRHQAEEHRSANALNQCDRCKRQFVSAARLARHKNGRCPGAEGKKKHEVDSYTLGRDLFKAVAPMTTTYWSDSFSE